jgi:hypothetical protein
MTIVHMCELSEEASELRTYLEDSGLDVVWGNNVLEVYHYADLGELVLLYEPEFKHVADELRGKFEAIELKPDTDWDFLIERLEKLEASYPQGSGAI